MKVTRILVAVLLLAVVASAAYAQPQVRLAWGVCDPYNSSTSNMNFTSPIVYKLVVSCIGAADQFSGHDTNLLITRGPLPDAWRFDDAGCQGSIYWSAATTGVSKTCPSLQGTGPLAITAFSINLDGSGLVRLANTFNGFTAVGTTRYTLFVVSFDHTYSVVGGGSPGATCGGAEVPLNLDSTTEFLLTSGGTVMGGTSEAHATWNGGIVATQPSTWSRVKGLYR